MDNTTQILQQLLAQNMLILDMLTRLVNALSEDTDESTEQPETTLDGAYAGRARDQGQAL